MTFAEFIENWLVFMGIFFCILAFLGLVSTLLYISTREHDEEGFFDADTDPDWPDYNIEDWRDEYEPRQRR